MTEDTAWLALWLASAAGGVVWMLMLYRVPQRLAEALLEVTMKVFG